MATLSDPAILVLPPVLDLAAAAPLQASLLQRRGRDLDVSAEGVERLGGLCLQVLLAARRSWVAEGRRLAVLAPSDPCVSALRVAGASGLLGVDD